MATKETASTLWKNLNRGLDSLYQKYKTLRSSTEASYEAQKEALEPEYTALRNSAAVQSRIKQANTDRRMVQKGLGTSGEAVRRELLQGVALQQNLTDIDLQESEHKAALDAEKLKQTSSLSAEEEGEVAQYIYRMNEAYYEQLDRDRKAALEQEKWKAEQKQTAFKNQLEEQKLELERQKQKDQAEIDRILAEAKLAAAKKTSSSGSSSSSSGSKTNQKENTDQKKTSVGAVLGVGGSLLLGEKNYTPSSVNAKALVKDIISQNSYTDAYGTHGENRKQIEADLRKVLGNTSLDQSYRYEVYFYAQTLGYL
ncbi:MAG: hypothetical protein II328_04390 [Clostridia bacterium]|nr:hypothetical protein [Clostridia bacterium]